MLLALALLLTPPAATPAPTPPPLSRAITLVCTGDGERRARQSSPFADPDAGFTGEATLAIDAAGAARLRLPDALIPRIHGGAKDGWWPVKDLDATRAEVRGAVRFNPFDRARLIADLGLGVITIDDNLGRFVGKCRETDAPP